MEDRLHITKHELRALNKARDVLTAIAERARAVEPEVLDFRGRRMIFGCGKVHEIAENTENSIFQVLNTARSYVDVEIDEDTMHNRKALVEVSA